MKYKIAEVNPVKLEGKLTVYFDDGAKTNPYSLYREWHELGEYGLKKRRKQLARYANLFSCSCVIHDFIRDHDEESR